MTERAGQAVSIDKLTLHVPAMSEPEARALVEGIGRALRRWPRTPAVGGRIERVKTTVTAPAAADPAQLAEQIAAAICQTAVREVGR